MLKFLPKETLCDSKSTEESAGRMKCSYNRHRRQEQPNQTLRKTWCSRNAPRTTSTLVQRGTTSFSARFQRQEHKRKNLNPKQRPEFKRSEGKTLAKPWWKERKRFTLESASITWNLSFRVLQPASLTFRSGGWSLALVVKTPRSLSGDSSNTRTWWYKRRERERTFEGLIWCLGFFESWVETCVSWHAAWLASTKYTIVAVKFSVRITIFSSGSR